MALPTRGTVATLSANGSSHTLSVTVPASGSLLIYVQYRRATTEDVTAISRDGQTPTLFATEGTFNGTGWATRVYYLTSANSGTADLSVTLSAGRNTRIIAIPYSGVDTGGTPWGTPTRETDLSTVYGASVTADQELVAIAGAYFATGSAQTFTPTGTGQTELDDNRINDQYAAASYQNETGTVTASWTFTATPDQASNWLVTVNGAGVSGPTITDQPDNVSVTLSEGNTASFTVAATGTGTLSYQWSVDDGGGYDTIGGATSATLNLTGIVIGQDGYLYRCAVTDDNGTTNSSAATISVAEGPAVDPASGTTNGSAVETTDLTTDQAGRVQVLAYRGATLVGNTTVLFS